VLAIRRLLFGALPLALVSVFPTSALAQSDSTTTPIKHVVVIFDENITFDHYFATYPFASNPPGEPAFIPKPNTPSVNGLTGALLTHNPNGKNPMRLDRSQAITCSNNHSYTPEQAAADGGLLDNFVATSCDGSSINLDYYDGNTVTALWNYAQRFALNDNSFDTSYGPSTSGAINLISGQTHALGLLLTQDDANHDLQGDVLLSASTIFGDPDPIFDDCGSPDTAGFAPSGSVDNHNIGDLLNEKGITWGWFEGGFNLSIKNPNGTTGCARSTTSAVTGVTEVDYIPHHAPFQYYTSTANLTHARPSSVAAIGSTDAANHQYDINDFFAAVKAGNFPSVSFLKAPGYQDGHAGYSDPLDEQAFVTEVINFLQQQHDWEHTAVIINYDDSDGWYDHQLGEIVNQSATSADELLGPGSCGDGTTALAGPDGEHAQGRCGYGPRLPYMVISPYARRNYVDHTLTDQSSTIRFIEDNWLGGQRIGNGSFDALAGSINNMFDFSHPGKMQPFILDPSSGEQVH